jgi:hypothetical protein
MASTEQIEELVSQKVHIMNKKVQDRKTQEIFDDNISSDEIQEILEVSESAQPTVATPEFSTISILATMKSIAHTIQSKARWQQFCEDHNTLPEIQTFSSKGDFKKAAQLIQTIAKPTHPRHIVMCTHLTRINDLEEIAKYISEINEELKKPRRIRLYLDEFDAYIKKMRPIINRLVMLDCIEKIVIVTATPEAIWKEADGWKYIFVLNPIHVNNDTYLSFEDCKENLILTESIKSEATLSSEWRTYGLEKGWNAEDEKLITLHAKIADQYPEIIAAGHVVFCPGNVSRRSHDAVGAFWNRAGCYSAIINGERTMQGFYGSLYLDNGRVEDIPHMRVRDMTTDQMIDYFKEKKTNPNDQAQLNDILAELYYKYELGSKAWFITGRLCVERAQTLVHPVWGTFTHAIYFKHKSPEDAYQQQRQLGHVKEWLTFRGIPMIFCSDSFKKDVLILEKRAHNFARKCHGTLASIDDYHKASDGALTMKEEKTIEKEKNKALLNTVIRGPGFSTIEDVNLFLRGQKLTTQGIRKFHETSGGYKVTSRLIPWYQTRHKKSNMKAEHLTDEDRLTMDVYMSLSNTCISTKSGQSYIVYPVYSNELSEPDDVTYYVRYLPVSEVIEM